MADEPTTPSSGGNVFTRKLGPLPMWVWMIVILLAALLYYFYKNRNGKSGNTSGASASPSTVNTPGGVDSSLVPQFVNQTYTTVNPPAAPAMPVSQNAAPLNEILTAGHAISVNPEKAVIGWTIKQATPNATQLKIDITGPGRKNQTQYVPASATQATFTDLAPGHTYVAYVTPVDAQGQAVGGPNHVTFVTAKKNGKEENS